MRNQRAKADLLAYIGAFGYEDGEQPRLPTLQEMSEELGVSIGQVREQMEVAKALGLVDVRPRAGIRRLPYSFSPAVRQSLNYAIGLDRSYFEQFSQLRNHVEAAYWYEAVSRLEPGDHRRLQEYMEQAWRKLRGTPIRIPHSEHRGLHLTIFRRLENPFVMGILEAFWEAYEAVGMNLYADYAYLQEVWQYHQQITDAICAQEFEKGYQALVRHKDLLFHRPESIDADAVREASAPDVV